MPKKVSNSLDIINIFLMLISAVLAYYLPFKLFLFSYAVLGPLHYLTEISWLRERSFFTKFRYDYLVLLLIGVILFINSAFTMPYLAGLFAGIVFFAFLASLVMVTTENTKTRLALCFLIIVLALIFNSSPTFYILFAVLLPTLVHVFVFTGCFILYGALVNKNKTGLLSVFVFVASFIGLFLLTVDPAMYTVSSYIKSAYHAFESVNLSVMNLLNINNPDTQVAVYASAAGLSIMRCIAFAYTYHYLNWFSKTKIIRWHAVPAWQLWTIISAWIFSVLIYLYDYMGGIAILFFLSILHVLLEFPLNHKTFIGIGRELRKIVSGAS